MVRQKYIGGDGSTFASVAMMANQGGSSGVLAVLDRSATIAHANLTAYSGTRRRRKRFAVVRGWSGKGSRVSLFIVLRLALARSLQSKATRLPRSLVRTSVLWVRRT